MTEGLPPGPKLHRLLQTAGFVLDAVRFMEWARRRYGDAVTLSTLFDDRFVVVFDPDLVRQIFKASSEQLHAGEANAILGPIVGERSVLLLDGDEHLRHRRMLLPPFHGRHLRDYEDAIRAATDAEIDSWPIGEAFPLLPSMQSLTLRVILEVVFGYSPPDGAELTSRLREFLDPMFERRRIRAILRLVRDQLGGRMRQRLGRRGRVQADSFAQRRHAVDQLLFAEIARRRALPEDELLARGDVFSALLLTEDEGGGQLSDREVRDELMTLLIAGHETTANGLAWAFDLLLHDPAVLARARAGDDAYLDAVAKETLRLRPVIGGVGRVVRGAPFQLGEWTIPEGFELNPSIRVIHRRADLFPDPKRFLPERFLGDHPPDTYTWVPFGGGTRRCLGAAFAQTEMRVVLQRVLERTSLRAASIKPDRIQLQVITLSPRNGAMAVLDQPPAPARAAGSAALAAVL